MDSSTINIWCWLIPLVVGVLCALFGYLLGKGNNTTTDNSTDLKLLQDKNAKLQANLDVCRGKVMAGTSDTIAVASVAATEKVIAFNTNAAKAAMGKVIKEDDLKVIEGIGPKIAGMFGDIGITTWKGLSETEVSDCQKVLDGGGNRYKVHDPASWPMQARMCYEGKWKDLSKWQDEHDHGKL